MARGEFDTGLLDRRLHWWLSGDASRGPGVRDEPERVLLPPESGVEPSAKPPVRIFLGTEPAQYRAERVFVWSVLRSRDPARAYEIHLMKELRGFDRSGWKTGFTRYRFAIPHFAGGRGRAIYNDVDQVYLADPAELFDTDLGDRGLLAIDQRETSVMLLDCEKLAPLWSLEDAQTAKSKKPFKKAAAPWWGELDPAWNARDHEYRPGTSRLLHYSTLHTQPWRPFPRDLRYREHPDAEVWLALEREADAAGFTVFTREHPSARFDASTHGEALARARGGRAPRGTLDRLPEEDVPWAIRELFEGAEGFVAAEVDCPPSAVDAFAPAWWSDCFRHLSRPWPALPWELVCRTADRELRFSGP